MLSRSIGTISFRPEQCITQSMCGKVFKVAHLPFSPYSCQSFYPSSFVCQTVRQSTIYYQSVCCMLPMNVHLSLFTIRPCMISSSQSCRCLCVCPMSWQQTQKLSSPFAKASTWFSTLVTNRYWATKSKYSSLFWLVTGSCSPWGFRGTTYQTDNSLSRYPQALHIVLTRPWILGHDHHTLLLQTPAPGLLHHYPSHM